MPEILSDTSPNEPITYLVMRGKMGGKKLSEKAAFGSILTNTRLLTTIAEYSLTKIETRTDLKYRYFDTFDAKLAGLGIFMYLAPLNDIQSVNSPSPELKDYEYVLHVDFPPSDVKSQETYLVPVPSGSDLYQLRPDDFRIWPATSRARQAGRNMPLQEMLRLNVNSTSFILQQDREERVVVSLDDIVATGPSNIIKRFHELVVRPLGGGREEVKAIASYFQRQYKHTLRPSLQSRWLNALQLITNGKIEAPEMADKDTES